MAPPSSAPPPSPNGIAATSTSSQVGSTASAARPAARRTVARVRTDTSPEPLGQEPAAHRAGDVAERVDEEEDADPGVGLAEVGLDRADEARHEQAAPADDEQPGAAEERDESDPSGSEVLALRDASGAARPRHGTRERARSSSRSADGRSRRSCHSRRRNVSYSRTARASLPSSTNAAISARSAVSLSGSTASAVWATSTASAWRPARVSRSARASRARSRSCRKCSRSGSIQSWSQSGRSSLPRTPTTRSVDAGSRSVVARSRARMIASRRSTRSHGASSRVSPRGEHDRARRRRMEAVDRRAQAGERTPLRRGRPQGVGHHRPADRPVPDREVGEDHRRAGRDGDIRGPRPETEPIEDLECQRRTVTHVTTAPGLVEVPGPTGSIGQPPGWSCPGERGSHDRRWSIGNTTDRGWYDRAKPPAREVRFGHGSTPTHRGRPGPRSRAARAERGPVLRPRRERDVRGAGREPGADRGPGPCPRLGRHRRRARVAAALGPAPRRLAEGRPPARPAVADAGARSCAPACARTPCSRSSPTTSRTGARR